MFALHSILKLMAYVIIIALRSVNIRRRNLTLIKSFGDRAKLIHRIEVQHTEPGCFKTD